MTKDDITRQFTVKQESALDLLALGRSDREVAEAVQVSRQTVNKWQHTLPGFQTALKERRADLFQESKAKLRALAVRAVAVLAEDLEGSDKKLRQAAAVQVLRACGLNGKEELSEPFEDLRVFVEGF